MAWSHQATSHYLIPCWPRFILPSGFTRPQWVKVEGWYTGLKMPLAISGHSIKQTMQVLITFPTDWLAQTHSHGPLRGHTGRADSRLAPSQWEMLLQSNGTSHWLGAYPRISPDWSSQVKFYQDQLNILKCEHNWSIEARCPVENEDVVGAASTGHAPTTSEHSTILVPTGVCLILEVLQY